MGEFFEKDGSTVVDVNFVEFGFGVDDLGTPLVEGGDSFDELLESEFAVSRGIHLLEHHEIFEVLAKVEEEDAEFGALDIVLPDGVFLFAFEVAFGCVKGS